MIPGGVLKDQSVCLLYTVVLFPMGVTGISLDETKASLLSGKLLKIASFRLVKPNKRCRYLFKQYFSEIRKAAVDCLT